MTEYQEVKYIRELNEYWDAFMFSLINEITVGIAINLGLSEKEAYAIARSKSDTLQKANFFMSIFDKFKKLFKYSVEPFRIKKKLIPFGYRPLTNVEWDNINKYLSEFWRRHADKVAEDMTVKGFMLGRDTTTFRRKRVAYRDKSLYQVVTDQYQGNMPDNIAQAYKKYDFKNSEKKALNKSFSRIAMYVSETDKKLQSAIRKEIIQGINEGKSGTIIASDLYWNIQKKAGNTAETFKKNWNRISQYEMAAVYEAGILAPYEAQAMESLKDASKAQYFVFTGGTCKWCTPHHGTLTRLVPIGVVSDSDNDSLKSMGIHDSNTDIAIWPGKNNIGKYSYKEPSWSVCTPAHPHGTATMMPIDLKTEYYDKETGRVEPLKTKIPKGAYRPKPISHIPGKEEKEYLKPTFIEGGKVRFNGNVYEAVEHRDYDKKKSAWDKNPLLPIPVDRNSTDYKIIFKQAK
jgi:hypothetical protein